MLFHVHNIYLSACSSNNSFSAIVLLKPPPPAFFPLQACGFVVSSRQKNTWQVTFRLTSPQILNQPKASPTQPRPQPQQKNPSLFVSVMTRSQVSIRGGKFWCQLFDLDWLGGKLDAPWMSYGKRLDLPPPTWRIVPVRK